MADDVPIYLILGHGEEQMVPFEERVQVPENVKIVTLAEAGTVSRMPEVCRIVNIFQGEVNRNALQNPRQNQANISIAIGQPIHIYTHGQRVPNLEVSPLAFFDLNDNQDIRATKVLRSGVQRFPLTKSVETEPFNKSFNEETQKKIIAFNKGFMNSRDPFSACGSYIKMYPRNLQEEHIREIYENSLYPTVEQALQYKGSLGQTFAYNFKKNLMDIVEEIGPGVYYYVICRADKKHSYLVETLTAYLLTTKGYFEEIQDQTKFTKEQINEMIQINKKIMAELLAIPDHVERVKRFLELFVTAHPAYVRYIINEHYGVTYPENIVLTQDMYETYGIFQEYRNFVNRSRMLRTASREQQEQEQEQEQKQKQYLGVDGGTRKHKHRKRKHPKRKYRKTKTKTKRRN